MDGLDNAADFAVVIMINTVFKQLLNFKELFGTTWFKKNISLFFGHLLYYGSCIFYLGDLPRLKQD